MTSPSEGEAPPPGPVSPGGGVAVCPWCLSTPPKHDYCEEGFAVFKGRPELECMCPCRTQGKLW